MRFAPLCRPCGPSLLRVSVKDDCRYRKCAVVSDFTDHESRVIGMMMKASKTLPDDFWAVAAVQTLACLFAKIEPLLTDEQAAELIGIGGYIAAVGKDEMKAEIGMKIAMARAGIGLGTAASRNGGIA